MELMQQGQILARKMQVLEGQKCKLINQVWKIETEQERLREKMRRIGYIPIFEIDEEPEITLKKYEK